MDIRYCMRICGPAEECRGDLTCRPSQCQAGEDPSAAKPCSLEGQSFCGISP
jgi:hypothetical protein